MELLRATAVTQVWNGYRNDDGNYDDDDDTEEDNSNGERNIMNFRWRFSTSFITVVGCRLASQPSGACVKGVGLVVFQEVTITRLYPPTKTSITGLWEIGTGVLTNCMQYPKGFSSSFPFFFFLI